MERFAELLCLECITRVYSASIKRARLVEIIAAWVGFEATGEDVGIGDNVAVASCEVVFLVEVKRTTQTQHLKF